MNVIEHRHFHGETCAFCRNNKLTLSEIERHTINKKTRQSNLAFCIVFFSQIIWIKNHNSTVCTKNESSIGQHKSRILHILLCFKPVTFKITCKRVVLSVVMPYSFRCAHPCITIFIENNTIYLQVAQSISPLHTCHLICFTIIVEQAIGGANDNISQHILTTTIHKLMSKKIGPAILQESVSVGIITAHSIGSRYPHQPLSVYHYTLYPAIIQAVFFSYRSSCYLDTVPCADIIHAESMSHSTIIEHPSVVVNSNVLYFKVFIVQYLLKCSTIWLIQPNEMSTTSPISVLAIANNTFNLRLSGIIRHHIALIVQGVDTIL